MDSIDLSVLPEESSVEEIVTFANSCFNEHFKSLTTNLGMAEVYASKGICQADVATIEGVMGDGLVTANLPLNAFTKEIRTPNGLDIALESVLGNVIDGMIKGLLKFLEFVFVTLPKRMLRLLGVEVKFRFSSTKARLENSEWCEENLKEIHHTLYRMGANKALVTTEAGNRDIFLREYHQSVDMLLNFLTEITKSINDFEDGKPVGLLDSESARNGLKAIAVNVSHASFLAEIKGSAAERAEKTLKRFESTDYTKLGTFKTTMHQFNELRHEVITTKNNKAETTPVDVVKDLAKFFDGIDASFVNEHFDDVSEEVEKRLSKEGDKLRSRVEIAANALKALGKGEGDFTAVATIRKLNGMLSLANAYTNFVGNVSGAYWTMLGQNKQQLTEIARFNASFKATHVDGVE